MLESGCRVNVPKSFRSNDSFVLAEKTFVAAATIPDKAKTVTRGVGWLPSDGGTA